jgi:hypothetical protein
VKRALILVAVVVGLCGCPKSVVVTPPPPPVAAYEVAIRWTEAPSPPAQTYVVLRNGVTLATVAAPTTSYVDTAIADGKVYTYAVLACTGGGKFCSAVSNSESATVP